MPQTDNATFLVITNYKGNPGSSEVTPRETETVHEACVRLNIRGVEDVYAPGDWDYDPETLCPTPNPW